MTSMSLGLDAQERQGAIRRDIETGLFRKKGFNFIHQEEAQALIRKNVLNFSPRDAFSRLWAEIRHFRNKLKRLFCISGNHIKPIKHGLYADIRYLRP